MFIKYYTPWLFANFMISSNLVDDDDTEKSILPNGVTVYYY